MRRLWLVGALVAALAGSAEALTVRDIVELTRAGLGDEVLLALIEVDRGVYAIDKETLKQLKAAGVSDRVIVALVKSGREVPVEPVPAPAVDQQPVEAPAPQVVVIDHQPERIVEVPVAVAVPVFIPSRRSRHHATWPERSTRRTSCHSRPVHRRIGQCSSSPRNPCTGVGEESCGRMRGIRASSRPIVGSNALRRECSFREFSFDVHPDLDCRGEQCHRTDQQRAWLDPFSPLPRRRSVDVAIDPFRKRFDIEHATRLALVVVTLGGDPDLLSLPRHSLRRASCRTAKHARFPHSFRRR